MNWRSAPHSPLACPLHELRRDAALLEAHLNNLSGQRPRKRGEVDPHLAIARAKIEDAETFEEAAGYLSRAREVRGAELAGGSRHSIRLARCGIIARPTFLLLEIDLRAAVIPDASLHPMHPCPCGKSARLPASEAKHASAVPERRLCRRSRRRHGRLQPADGGRRDGHAGAAAGPIGSS